MTKENPMACMISCGMSDLSTQGWTLESLIGAMLDLDRICMPHVGSEHIGTVSQWLPIYRNYPDTWRVLLDKSGKLRAFWHFVAVNQAAFERIVDGILPDNKIGIADIADIARPGVLQMYLTSVSVHPSCQSGKTFRWVLNTWMQSLSDLANRGVFFRSLALHALTPEGVRLCRHTGMKRVEGITYTLEMLPLPLLPWLGKYQQLVQRYEACATDQCKNHSLEPAPIKVAHR